MSTKQKTALVVDDCPIIRKIHTLMLERLGFAVTTVANGLQALNAAHPFDLVLMDCEMPIMDGPTAATAMRGMGIETTIVGVTASAMRDKCVLSGMNTCLAKPLKADALAGTISHLLPVAA